MAMADPDDFDSPADQLASHDECGVVVTTGNDDCWHEISIARLFLVAGDGENETNPPEHGNESRTTIRDEGERDTSERSEGYHGG